LGGYHAKLNFIDGKLTIDDLDSAYGTWFRLSDSKAESKEYLIESGYEIKINPHCFKCRFSQDMQQIITDKCILCLKNE
jgi:hypothetical protein